MSFYFHVNTCRVLFVRVLAVACLIFLLAACGQSRMERNCLNAPKEKKDMTSDASSAAHFNAEIKAPAGQETAIFGMG
jgi:hypothetical protein